MPTFSNVVMQRAWMKPILGIAFKDPPLPRNRASTALNCWRQKNPFAVGKMRRRSQTFGNPGREKAGLGFSPPGLNFIFHTNYDNNEALKKLEVTACSNNFSIICRLISKLWMGGKQWLPEQSSFDRTKRVLMHKSKDF